jgi:hypothetical protein
MITATIISVSLVLALIVIPKAKKEQPVIIYDIN